MEVGGQPGRVLRQLLRRLVSVHVQRGHDALQRAVHAPNEQPERLPVSVLHAQRIRSPRYHDILRRQVPNKAAD